MVISTMETWPVDLGTPVLILFKYFILLNNIMGDELLLNFGAKCQH